MLTVALLSLKNLRLNRTAQGQWPVQDSTEHVIVLELWAVHLALKHFLPYLKGKHVLIQSDNTSPSAVDLATEGPDSLLRDCADPVKETILNARALSTLPTTIMSLMHPKNSSMGAAPGGGCLVRASF